MRYFKFLLFPFLLFCSYTWSLTINKPPLNEKIRGQYEIRWSDGTPPYTIEITQGTYTETHITSSESYLFDTQSGSFQDGSAKVRVEDGSGFDERNFTIDNTPPVSDLIVMGTQVTPGQTVNFSGNWWENLSGISGITKVELYEGTESDTTIGQWTKIEDITSNPIIVNNPSGQSGTYSGSYTLPKTLIDGHYISFRIVIEDNAVDKDGIHNSSIDWTPPILVKQIKIKIEEPEAGKKYRDEIKIKWSIIEGTPPAGETYSIYYYDGTWQEIASGISAYEYQWDTNGLNLNLKTKIKVCADTCGAESVTEDFIIDNTPPVLNSVSVSGSESIIPDVNKGNSGRYVINVKKVENWYNKIPVTISFYVEDPLAPDGSFSGIKAVAYRFTVGDGDWQSIIYSGNNQIEKVSIDCDIEGKDINLEVYVLDDAQNSLTPSDLPYEVSTAVGSGNNNGNYSYNSSVLPSPINIDITPPTIYEIHVDKLPDGPILNGIHWYKSIPVIYLSCSDSNGSGILEEVVAFTVDGVDLPKIDFSGVSLDENGEGAYVMNLLNGERVVFKSYLDKIGIEKPKSAFWKIYFPVFNSYGKEIKVRIWDKAGNISEQKVENPLYIETDAYGNRIRQEQVILYVDTVPPDTKATLTGDYLPTQYKDIGTYERSYTDIWRHNREFPRPEDCPPPSNYPYDYIDYIYYASLNNKFLTPFSISLTATDSLYEIYDRDITNKRPLTILPGHPDYDPRYDFFFSDFTSDNIGSGILGDLTGIQYRTTDRTSILTDLRNIIKVGNKFYAVGEKGVILESDDGEYWNLMTYDGTPTLYGIYGESSNNIWACGENGKVIRFDGIRWQEQNIDWDSLGIDKNNPPTFYSIYIDNNDVWVAGTGGTVLKYDGTNWSKEDTGVNVNLYGIRKIGDNIYTVGASGAVLKYDGTSWTKEDTNIDNDLYAICEDTSGNIYVFGNIEDLSKIGYLKYSSGYGWTLETTNIASSKNSKKRVPIYSAFVDGSNIYASGRNGTVIKFDGSSWNDVSPDDVRDVIYGVCASDGKIYIVGESGLTGVRENEWTINSKWDNWKNCIGEIKLSEGITSIEYFAIDNLGNEEEHHKIIDPGKGYRKDTYDGKAIGNLRSDDNVPDPEIEITPSSPDGENGWYISTVKIKFNYSNPDYWLDPLPTGEIGSGIKKFQYALLKSPGIPNDSDFIDYTADRQTLQEITFTEGTYYIYYRAEDNLGNKSYRMVEGEIKPYLEYIENPLKIDLRKPVCSIRATGDGRYEITANDTNSGISKIYYKDSVPANKTDGTEYTGPFTINPGVTKIYYWAIDNAGNSDFYNVYNVGIEDMIPPTVILQHISGSIYPSIDVDKIYVSSEKNRVISNRTKLGIQANDNETGIKDIRYKFNDQPQDPYTDGLSYFDTGDFYIPEDTTKIYYWAIDGANNYNIKSKDIVVDDTGPTIEIILDPSNPDTSTWYNTKTGKPILQIGGNDGQGSGVKQILYDLNGSSNPQIPYTEEIELDDGQYDITVSIEDNLGNKSFKSYENNPVKVDTEIPTTTYTRDQNRVTLTGTDLISGLNYIYYFTTDDDSYVPQDSDWQEVRILTGNSIIITLPTGHNKIWYKSKDKAGNDSVVSYAIFVSEMNAPIVNVSIRGSVVDDKVKNGNTVIIEGTWQDESGPIVVEKVRLLDQGGNLIVDLPVDIVSITDTTNGQISGSFVVPQLSQDVSKIKLELEVRDQVSTEDYLCNRKVEQSNELEVDNKFPEIKIKAYLTNLTPNIVNGIWWYKEPVPIEIEVSDEVGIEQAEYSLDGGITWYEVIDERNEIGKKNFNLEASATKIKVKARDKVGNEIEVEGIKEFVDGIDYYDGLIYVDTYPPKVTIKILNNKYWPTIPPANVDNENPELPIPEGLSIDYIYINSSSNPKGGTIFKLVADDTPQSSPTSDGKASCGFSLLFGVPNYRISKSLEVLDSEEKWENWINPRVNYQDKNNDGYYEYSETDEFSLPEGTTSIWYFAIDNLGNKEEHKIVEIGRSQQQEIGKGNIRVDDSVPEPEIIIEPANPDGNNGWYKQGVSIRFYYEDDNDYLDPLPTGEIGSGLKAFQYVVKTESVTPDDSEFNNYTIGTQVNISVEGTYYVFYRAVDNIGNVSLKMQVLKIDGTKPNVSLNLSDGVFTLIASDSGSGVEKVSYKFIFYDGAEELYERSGSSATFTTPAGINSIEYWAVDYAGNESDHQITNISIFDTTPPVTTINYSQPYYLSGNTLYVTSSNNTASTIGKTQFTIDSTDPRVNNFASGIVSVYPVYKIENSVGDWTVYSSPFNVASGDIRIEAYAIDGAGNIGNTAILNIVVDDEPPIIEEPYFDRNPDSNNWYNLNTGRPNIVINYQDTGSGIYEILYSFNGVNYSSYTQPIPIDEGKELSLTLYVKGVDNLRNTITTIFGLPLINVDITKPVSSMEVLSGRKFKIKSIDNVSGIKEIWYQFDNNTPVSINFSTQELNAETEEINLPVETKQIKYWSVDFAGNNEDVKTYDVKQIKISGYVKDYSGNPLSNIKVILTGEANKSTFTDGSGYYEFDDLSSIGIYYIIPFVQISLPFMRGYDGTATSDLENQNFIITNGWRFKEYALGNTNDYYFKPNTVLPSNSQLTLEQTFGLGGDILTGDIDNDKNLDLIIKGDSSGVVYSYDKNKGYTQKGGFSTTYTLNLFDSIDIDTNLEIILTGFGQNLFEIYDNKFNKISSISYSGLPLPPTDTRWGVRIAENYILIAGTGTNPDNSVYTNVMLYDYTNNNVKWTENFSQRIEPDKLNICLRDDNRVIVVFGGISDNGDLKVYALDIFTGEILWTKDLNSNGRIVTLTSNIYGGSSYDIIGIKFSTNANSVPLTIYRFDLQTGNILGQYSLPVYTENINYALSDIDNDNVKELIISDSNENLYLVDTSNLTFEKQGSGKIWATVDFDKKIDGKKELIVTTGTYLKVLDYNLTEIMSYNLNDNIKKVIVSDINNDGIIEIIVSSATNTYVLRPTTTRDLPNAPTNLRCELGINYINIYWNYVPNTATLKGFKIYRSLNPSNWGSPVQIINDPNARTTTDTPPSAGLWYYKVSAFNDYGEVDCKNPTSYLIEYKEIFPTEEGGGCFIASVCFGENSWQVKILKEFRDRILMKFEKGKRFVKFYYKYSPCLRDYIKDKTLIKTFVKIILYPVVFVSWFLTHLIPGMIICLFFASCIFYRKKINCKIKKSV
ncbi:MAG: PQQ-binding-like beta-propeller repeat protein [Candidatus Omnitrophica bacterium]|nr:PQQ-binding-like beta-propeller repeat protein [Candidatus Omnitrophota bacterium]